MIRRLPFLLALIFSLVFSPAYGEDEQAQQTKVPKGMGRATPKTKSVEMGGGMIVDAMIYEPEWTVRSGVKQLNLPVQDGWENWESTTKPFQNFKMKGREGERLEAVLFNKAFNDAYRYRIFSFYNLIWMPVEYEYSVFSQRLWDSERDKIRQEHIDARAEFIVREHFGSLEDFQAYRDGRDREVSKLVPEFEFEAANTFSHLTYIRLSKMTLKRSELVRKAKKKRFWRAKKSDDVPDELLEVPIAITRTYAWVGGKIVQMEVKRVMHSDEDISSLLNFVDNFVQEFRVRNQ